MQYVPLPPTVPSVVIVNVVGLLTAAETVLPGGTVNVTSPPVVTSVVFAAELKTWNVPEI